MPVHTPYYIYGISVYQCTPCLFLTLLPLRGAVKAYASVSGALPGLCAHRAFSP